MKIALHIALLLFRIAAGLLSLLFVFLEWFRFHEGNVSGRLDGLLSVLFCVYWVTGIFPIAEVMLRRRGWRPVLGLVFVVGFAMFALRYLLPYRYAHFWGVDFQYFYSNGNIWSWNNFVGACFGLLPPLVCLFEYLWMRYCAKPSLEPTPVPST